MGSENQHYGLLRSVVAGSLQSLSYDYDAVGNVQSIVEASSRLSEMLEFEYDHLDRLIRVRNAYVRDYDYDRLGNLTNKGGQAQYYPAAGSAHPHAPYQVGTNGYSYDQNGNLIGAEGRTYSYDVENRLTQVSGSGVPTRAFEYDGDGALRQVSEGGSAKRRYVTSDYQVELPSGEPVVYYRFGGRVVAWHNNTALRYLLADHLSSTRAEVGESKGRSDHRWASGSQATRQGSKRAEVSTRTQRVWSA